MVQVNPDTNCPDRVWSFVSKEFMVANISYENPVHKPENSVRIVCTSDTHCYTDLNFIPIPDGEIFIHAGDFTMNGLKNQITKFNDWLGKLPHKYKIVIAGNHELTFDPAKSKKHLEMKKLLTNCIYLEDTGVTLYGLNIWGTPWQPTFGGWAFNIDRGKEILEKWNQIPSETDILISHGPPLGVGDLCRTNSHVGCVELLSTIRERLTDLKLHVFGHIHEAYGVYETNEIETVFVNASMCNVFYNPVNQPFVFDFTMRIAEDSSLKISLKMPVPKSESEPEPTTLTVPIPVNIPEMVLTMVPEDMPSPSPVFSAPPSPSPAPTRAHSRAPSPVLEEEEETNE